MTPRPPAAQTPAPVPPLGRLLAVFFLSGAAALVYQVLWLKQLGRLFGVSAYATSTTLAVFFLGLAAGGWVWGRRAARLRRPLRAYAALEVAIGVSALLYFALFAAYRAIQPALFGALGYRPAAVLAVKFLLALGILFLPAFFMGGTLPVMAQVLVRERSELGSRTSLLYAVNTVGAASGALAAGFVLPRLLGFRGAYLLAIAVNLLVAALTAWWARAMAVAAPATPPNGSPAARSAPPRPASAPPRRPPLTLRRVRLLAAFSGFATLALEVLWTRMFQQVLQNSVYTFAVILTVFLLALALGAALAHRLCRRPAAPARILADLLLLSGLAVALTPWFFQRLAGGLEFWHSDAGFWTYVALAFAGTAAVLGPAVVVMGAVFPFLMKVGEPTMESAGRTVGELASINTLLAIAGSLLAGFAMLGTLGLWSSVWVIGASYFAVAALVAASVAGDVAATDAAADAARRSPLRLALAVAGIAACLLLAATHDLGSVRVESVAAADPESIVDTWEGPDGTVAVVRHGGGDLRLRINSSYNLGTTASAANERLQGQIPFLLHPHPRSVFFLGLGTGISAGGALDFPFERLTVCEVNPDVVEASRRYFRPWLQGLFDDPRVRVVPEDGRTWLAVSDERYDLVVGDIFLSYKAGVGSLYTREHFAAVRDSLAPGGLFVQWVPTFDTSRRELAILARTMLDVFPSVTLWRRSFSPVFPVYALVASMETRPLDPQRLDAGLARLADGGMDPQTWLLHIPLAAYVADLGRLRDGFADAPLNTDDRTVLEYLAPITERNSKGARTAPVLAWEELLRFCEELQAAAPPQSDPYLARVGEARRRQVRAGTDYYGYEVMRRLGRDAEAAAYLERYRRELAP